MGTAVGTEVFVKYGWRASAALSLGWYGWQLFILLLRGPHCQRYTWFGYEGGVERRKSVVDSREKNQDIVEQGLEPSSPDEQKRSSTEK